MSNVIIGQSGGPTAVINSSLAGAIRAAKDHGIKKVYGMHHGIEVSSMTMSSTSTSTSTTSTNCPS